MQVDRFYDEESSSGNKAERCRDAFAMCCSAMWCSFPALLHRNGFTPYSYNTDSSDVRHQHYKATAAFTFVATVATLLITIGATIGFSHATEKEDAFLNAMGDVSHFEVGVLTLLGMAAAVGAIGFTAHSAIDKCRGIDETRAPTDIQLVQTEGGTQYRTTEDSSLLRSDSGRVFGGALATCDIRRTMIPATPGKTFGWFMGLTAVGLGLSQAIDHTFFNMITESSYGHYGSVATGLAIGGFFAAGVATGLHAAGAKIAEKCGAGGSVYDSITEDRSGFIRQ